MMDLPLKAPEECRILIADDDASIRDLYRRILIEEGFMVDLAESGEEALALVRQNPPDLLIVDVLFPTKPNPDGYEVCRTIKSEFSEKFIPVILVTGMEKERVEGLSVGADDFLTKPIRKNELKVLVHSLIRTKQLYEIVVLSREDLERRVFERTRELESANQRLQELDSMKSNIIQIISHELRTPLHRGRAALALAQDKDSLLEDDIIAEMFDTVERSFVLLESRIEDIELFSDPANIEMSAYPISDILMGAAGQAQVMADGQEAPIYFEIAEDLPPVWANARSVSKAVSHLIHNGLKFSQYQPVTLTASLAPEGVFVTVNDNGPGIPPGMIARLREPMKQEDISTTRAYSGMGIGLALASMVFDMHGIIPTIHSEDGRGTTISFVLVAASL